MYFEVRYFIAYTQTCYSQEVFVFVGQVGSIEDLGKKNLNLNHIVDVTLLV